MIVILETVYILVVEFIMVQLPLLDGHGWYNDSYDYRANDFDMLAREFNYTFMGEEEDVYIGYIM